MPGPRSRHPSRCGADCLTGKGRKDTSSCAAPRLNVGPMLMNLGGDPYGLSKTSQSNACSRRPLPAFQCGPRRKTWQRGRGASAPTRGKGGSCGKGGTPNWPSTLRHLTHKRKLPRANLRSPYRPSTGGCQSLVKLAIGGSKIT